MGEGGGEGERNTVTPTLIHVSLHSNSLLWKVTNVFITPNLQGAVVLRAKLIMIITKREIEKKERIARGKVHHICFRQLHQHTADAKRFGLIQRRKSSTCLSGDGRRKRSERTHRKKRERCVRLRTRRTTRPFEIKRKSNRASGVSGEKLFWIEQ